MPEVQRWAKTGAGLLCTIMHVRNTDTFAVPTLAG